MSNPHPRDPYASDSSSEEEVMSREEFQAHQRRQEEERRKVDRRREKLERRVQNKRNRLTNARSAPAANQPNARAVARSPRGSPSRHPLVLRRDETLPVVPAHPGRRRRPPPVAPEGVVLR